MNTWSRYFLFGILYLLQQVFRKRIKPRVIQMPITGRCNSRCVTCEIWKQKEKENLNPQQLKVVLSDPFFSQVRVVGINGGEPSLYPQIPELLQSLFILKRLNRLHFISNGLLEDRLLKMMEIVAQQCRPRHIRVYLTISVDGIGEVHNQIRGIPGAFDKTVATLKRLANERERYCDVLDAGCTLSRQNVAYAIETESFLTQLGIASYYHPAVPNKRLHNYENQHFSILNDERSRLLACEYFYYRFKKGKGLKNRWRSFLTYYYLLHHGQGRLAGCNYLRSDVTITENLRLYLCAAASDEVGNLRQQSASSLLNAGAFQRQTRFTAQHCNTCVHYIIFPTFRGSYLFIRQMLHPLVWLEYKWNALWLRLR